MPSDEIVDHLNETTVVVDAGAEEKPLLATAYDLLEEANSTLPENRQVLKSTIREVVRRELPETPRAYRAVINFLTTVENPDTNTPTKHTDLLHPGHPLSTVQISSFRRRRAAAQYFACDTDLPAHVQPLVASAIEVEPESVTRRFYEELLFAQKAPLKTVAVIEAADKSIKKKMKAEEKPEDTESEITLEDLDY